jgi:hypothetical protein
MLAVASRKQRGPCELVFVYKVAITVFAIAAGNTPDAKVTWPIDLAFVLVTGLAYVLCRGWYGWQAADVSVPRDAGLARSTG